MTLSYPPHCLWLPRAGIIRGVLYVNTSTGVYEEAKPPYVRAPVTTVKTLSMRVKQQKDGWHIERVRWEIRKGLISEELPGVYATEAAAEAEARRLLFPELPPIEIQED